MKNTITIARERNNEMVKHISEVANGLKCDCVCIECSSKLVAANKGTKQIHHFRHHESSDCNGSPETGLHLLAKKIIEESNYINLKRNKKLNYSEYKSEKQIQNIIPDVQIINELGETWLIEILVTHKVDEAKLEKIKRLNLNCLEIDLSKVDRFISKDELKEIVIDQINLKSILNEVKESEEVQSESTKGRFKFDFSHLLFLIGVLILGKYLIQKR